MPRKKQTRIIRKKGLLNRVRGTKLHQERFEGDSHWVTRKELRR